MITTTHSRTPNGRQGAERRSVPRFFDLDQTPFVKSHADIWAEAPVGRIRRNESKVQNGSSSPLMGERERIRRLHGYLSCAAMLKPFAEISQRAESPHHEFKNQW
jgi:hypothetical protein